MELFLPSLVLIIIAAFFVFLVVPRISPNIIFLLCIFFLFTMVQSHYTMFKEEYKLNSWRDQLRVLAQPLLISVIVIGVVFTSTQFLLKLNLTNLFTMPKTVTSTSKYGNISPTKLEELEKQL